MKITRAIDFTMKNHHKFVLVWYLGYQALANITATKAIIPFIVAN